jgi:hypothetical protein
LKEEALDLTLWRSSFGRGYGPVVRQTTEWMNDIIAEFHVILLVKWKAQEWKLRVIR